MPSLHHIPLEGAALREFYDEQAKICHIDHSNSQTRQSDNVASKDECYDRMSSIQDPILDCIVSSCNEKSYASAGGNYAADCNARREEDVCAYPNKSNCVHNNTKRGEEGYLSDTILDKALNCDYTHTSETHDHTSNYVHNNTKGSPQKGYLSDTILDKVLSCDYTHTSEETHDHTVQVQVPSSLDKRKRQNQTSENNKIGTVIAIRKRFKSHHAHHQRGEDTQERGYHPTVPPTQQQHSTIPFSASTISNSVSGNDEQNRQDTSFHDSSFVCEDEALYTNDTTASARVALIEGTTKVCETKENNSVATCSSFEKYLEELKAYQAKHGNCDVKRTGDYSDLGMWCSKVRQSMQKIKNNLASIVPGLSADNIKRLEDIGFDFKLKREGKPYSFEERYEQLKAHHAKYGHFNVKAYEGVDKALGRWIWKVKRSINNIMNDQAPLIAGLSQDNIKRLEDIGIDWKDFRRRGKVCSFEGRLEELKAYQAKHGNCNVKRTGEHKALGEWCSKVRQSMQKIKDNVAPIVGGLSENNIKRLEDMGFDFKFKRKRTSYSFEERLEQLKAYQAKHGHLDVKAYEGDDKTLGKWLLKVKRSISNIMNDEAPLVDGLSPDNIKRLEDMDLI